VFPPKSGSTKNMTTFAAIKSKVMIGNRRVGFASEIGINDSTR
jgi:hypothetical protein